MTAQLFRALWRIDLDRRSYPSLDDHAMRRLQVLSPETDLRSPAAAWAWMKAWKHGAEGAPSILPCSGAPVAVAIPNSSPTSGSAGCCPMAVLCPSAVMCSAAGGDGSSATGSAASSCETDAAAAASAKGSAAAPCDADSAGTSMPPMAARSRRSISCASRLATSCSAVTAGDHHV